MSLSISVSAPVTTRFTSLPCSREICRTTRASLSNACPSGTMRTSRIPLCICARCRSKVRFRRCSSIASSRASAARPRTRSVRLRDRRLHDRELADDGHQAIELADVDADGLAHRAQRELLPACGPRPGRDRRERRRIDGAGFGAAGSPAACGRSPSRAPAAATSPPTRVGGAKDSRRRRLGRRRRWRARAARSARRARRTSSMATFGPGDGAAQELDGGAARHEDLELDGVDVGAGARRQVRDDLAVRPRLRLELVEGAVDRREREAHADAIEALALLDVRAEAVLLVLGEHAEQPGVEVVLRDDARAARRRAAARTGRARRAAARPRRGIGALAASRPRGCARRARPPGRAGRARPASARCARGAGRRARPRARARGPPCASRRRAPTAP